MPGEQQPGRRNERRRERFGVSNAGDEGQPGESQREEEWEAEATPAGNGRPAGTRRLARSGGLMRGRWGLALAAARPGHRSGRINDRMDPNTTVTIVTVASIVMVAVGALASVLWFVFRLDREQEKDEQQKRAQEQSAREDP